MRVRPVSMLTFDPEKAKPRTAALDLDSTTPSVYSLCIRNAVSVSSAMAPMPTASRIPLASAELICAGVGPGPADAAAAGGDAAEAAARCCELRASRRGPAARKQIATVTCTVFVKPGLDAC